MLAEKLLNGKITYWFLRLSLQNRKNPEKNRRHQFTRLKKLIEYTYREYEFYRELWQKNGFDPSKFNNIDDTEKIPVITKDLYRDFIQKTVKDNPDKYKQYFRDSSSGSTGMPLVLYRTWGERAYMLAKFIRALFHVGMGFTDKLFYLPAPYRISKEDSFLQRFGILQRSCVANNLPVEDILKAVLEAKPNILYCTRSHLLIMAEFILENGKSKLTTKILKL